jgi:hypothetical protein
MIASGRVRECELGVGLMLKYLVVVAALTLAAPGLAFADDSQGNKGNSNGSDGPTFNPPKFPLVFNGAEDGRDRDRHHCKQHGNETEEEHEQSQSRGRDNDDCPASP